MTPLVERQSLAKTMLAVLMTQDRGGYLCIVTCESFVVGECVRDWLVENLPLAIYPYSVLGVSLLLTLRLCC